MNNEKNCDTKNSYKNLHWKLQEQSEKDVLHLHEDNYEIIQVIGESLETSDKESEESENSGSSVGSKEYEIVENDNN